MLGLRPYKFAINLKFAIIALTGYISSNVPGITYACLGGPHLEKGLEAPPCTEFWAVVEHSNWRHI
jgi:hypothetical protein